MNWNVISGNWKQLQGKFREKWGNVTDDEWTQLGGKKDQIAGKLQEKYGYTQDQANKELDAHAKGLETHPDTRGLFEKVADAVTGDRIDDKTGKIVR